MSVVNDIRAVILSSNSGIWFCRLLSRADACHDHSFQSEFTLLSLSLSVYLSLYIYIYYSHLSLSLSPSTCSHSELPFSVRPSLFTFYWVDMGKGFRRRSNFWHASQYICVFCVSIVLLCSFSGIPYPLCLDYSLYVYGVSLS
ncbi:hypothetical protein VNO77_05732 [Canavalia gladiata]|uniref:Uncharacterized protein n=1 Tax=Canavalia gladiata TaxID=3824 RepID=A0AAN9MYW3_CANGL